MRLGDNRYIEFGPPELKLLNCCRSKSITGREHNGVPRILAPGCQFCTCRRFADTIYADHQNNIGSLGIGLNVYRPARITQYSRDLFNERMP